MKKLILSISLLGILLPNLAIAQTDYSGREKIYRGTHTKMTELKHTKLKVSFDFEKEHLLGEEWLTASPYFYPTDSLVLNAKAMLIHDVALDKNGIKQALTYDYKNDILKINLDKTYQKNQDYTVYIKYTARPNEVKQKGSAAINDAKGLYFINAQGKDPDKPTQIWTQGETESSSVWFPTIDKTNQKTTQEIYMTVPDQYVTLSNGLLKKSTKQGNGLRTDYWVMDKKHSPYLFFMGVGDFAIVKDQWKNIPVNYYVEKEYEPYAKQIFGNTPEMMEFFSNKLNYPYPWAKYDQMAGRDYVSGAMENTTATLHGEAAQQKPGDLIDENKWEDTIAHELFHHWFGDLVTAESWSNLTVNESLADYSEYLWNEYKYGKDEADYKLLKSIRAYQINPNNFSKNLVRFDYSSREDVFDTVTYNKGGGILHMLRNYLGDDAFYAGLHDYLKTYEYGSAEAHNLRLSFEKVSGKDLNWFFNQWFYGSGHPKLSINYTFEPIKKQVNVAITQTQNGAYFQFPLTIDVYENGIAKRYNVWADAKANNNFTFNYSQQPNLVNVNADQVLLAEMVDNKTADQYLVQFTKAKEIKSRLLAVDYAKENISKNATSLKILSAALKDASPRIRVLALSSIDLSNTEQSKLMLKDVEKLATNDPKTLVQAEAINALSKTQNKSYISLYEKATTAISNSVKGNAIAAIADIDAQKAINLMSSIDLSNASEDLTSKLLPLIVKNKITSQMSSIASQAAFYPFIKFQDATLGTVAEEGYNWIMTSDNTKATKAVTKIIAQAKSEILDNPQAKMMMIQILKDGLNKKMQLLKDNPKSQTLHEQIDAINKTIEDYNH